MNLGDTRLLIEVGRERGLLRNQMAYVLATAFHETAHSMKPAREMGGENFVQRNITRMLEWAMYN